MANRLITTDCDSVPDKDKLKPRIAASRIRELSADGANLPKAIPELSLIIRAITCYPQIKDRLELLRLLNKPVANILQLVHDQNIGITLPIEKNDIKLLGVIDGLLRDFICGFNSIIVEARGSVGFMRAASKAHFAEACFGSITFQTHRQMLAYEAYRPVRKGVWSQIHLAYKIACENSVENIPLQIERPDNTYEYSIEHVYKRAILIGRSDPYHFSFKRVTRLFESLDRWQGLVRLTKKIETAKSNNVFIIDLSSDFPAAPYFQNSSKVKDGEFLLLDTTKLMERLDDELKTLMISITGGLKGINQVHAFERMEILRHIVVSWGMHLVRKAEREELDTDCKIVFGLTNIFRILHPDKYTGESDHIDFESTAEIQMVLGVFQEKIGQIVDKNASVSSWKIINESRSGYCLSHTKPGAIELRVGDILALQKNWGDGWDICIVRWATENDGGQLQIGIFKIGSGAEPVSVKPLETGREFALLEYTAALHISESTSFSNTKLIVAQKTVYSPGRHLYMKRDERKHRIVATRLVVSSRSVDVFSYRYDAKSI